MTLILSGTDGVSDIDGTAATPAIRGTDANTGIFFGTDIIGFSEGGTEAMRINASGNLQTIGTISVGNATPSTSGAGVTFPATQSASSDANTLDDYEEGTWSPTVTSSGGSITTYTASGTYTKIGRVVYLTATINITTVGTASGTMTITTNPFTPAVVGSSRWRNDNTGAHGDTLVEGTAFYVLAPTWANNRWYANIVYQTS